MHINNSQITISTSSGTTLLQKTLQQAETKIIGAIVRQHTPSIANAVIEMPGMHDKLWSYFLNLVVSEFQVLCCKEPLSLFRHMPVKEIDQFQWEPLMTELQCKAPLLLKLLSAVVVREDTRCQVKPPTVHYPAIVTATAILLKERNREMSGVQSIVSCLMYACHSEKQVLYTWLVHTFLT